jgi:tripartite-type tricarboxylate transporter receptor subunit TctC
MQCTGNAAERQAAFELDRTCDIEGPKNILRHRGLLRRHVRGLLASALFLAGLCVSPATESFAEPYPTKPVRIIVPFSPGGVADIGARVLAEKMTEKLGQRVIVDNRPGAGGSLGMDVVARSPADGYTLLMASPGLVTNPSLQPNLSWDPVKSFTPVAMIASIPNVFVVGSKIPVSTLPELIAYAKADPGGVTYASAGIGSSNHLAGELLSRSIQVEMVHVPYKGQGDALKDLMEGSVKTMALTAALAKPQIDSGRLKAIAVTTLSRSAILPNVPTVSEAGLPGFEVNAWIAMFLPAGASDEIVAKLNGTMREIAALPEVKDRFLQLGAELSMGSPAELGSYIRAEVDKWSKVIRDTNIKID